MDLIDEEQIKDWCEEALELTDQHGVDEGLSFLIGQKFFEVFWSLKKAQNQARFLYQDTESLQEDFFSDQTLKLNYSMTLHQNYGELLDQLQNIEKVREFFVREIKDAFDINDIEDYLKSYPRLGIALDSIDVAGDTKVTPFSVQEVLSEVDDILTIEEFLKLFSLGGN